MLSDGKITLYRETKMIIFNYSKVSKEKSGIHELTDLDSTRSPEVGDLPSRQKKEVSNIFWTDLKEIRVSYKLV